jgi:hypothetical protein
MIAMTERLQLQSNLGYSVGSTEAAPVGILMHSWNTSNHSSEWGGNELKMRIDTLLDSFWVRHRKCLNTYVLVVFILNLWS